MPSTRPLAHHSRGPLGELATPLPRPPSLKAFEMQEAPGHVSPWPKAFQALATQLLRHSPTEQAAALATCVVLSPPKAGSRHPPGPTGE